MKFKVTDLSGFSDIGTVVFYKSRVFYPEFAKVSPQDSAGKLIEQGKTENYLYSTSMLSEYTDFGVSGFTWTRENLEYLPEMLPNLYNYQKTSELVGTPFIDPWVSMAFPSYLENKNPSSKHFFGRLGGTLSGTTYLVYLPSNTWKVEVYNSRITGNYFKSEDRPGFIDYDILQKLVRQGSLSPEQISEEPGLSIYFGPSYDTKVENLTYSELEKEELNAFPLYRSRYVLNDVFVLPESEYNEFEKTMTRTEYIESYREEVLSEKMLYIVNSPSGKIESVNFYSIAYPESRNPHPWMSDVALRNDHLLNYTPEVLNNPVKNLWVDSRSGSLLGVKSMNPQEVSWWTGTSNEEKIYSKSGKTSETWMNGKTWRKSVSEDVFGENPEISPLWYSPDELPKSRFKYFYLIKSKGEGTMEPGGLVYVRDGSSLNFKVFPAKGYKYSKVSGASSVTQNGSEICINEISGAGYPIGHKFGVEFEEIQYKLNLQVSCENDYPRGKRGSNYNLYGGNPKEYDSLTQTGIILRYLSEDGTSMEYSNPLSVTYNKNLYFNLDTSSSKYEIDGDFIYGDGSKIPMTDDQKWYVLNLTDPKFPESILSGETLIPIVKIKPKKYTVTISSVSGVQISTPKVNTLEYHNIDPKDRNMTPRDFIVSVTLGDKKIEVYQEGRLTSEKDKCWRKEEKDGVYTLIFSNIENNYNIVIK